MATTFTDEELDRFDATLGDMLAQRAVVEELARRLVDRLAEAEAANARPPHCYRGNARPSLRRGPTRVWDAPPMRDALLVLAGAAVGAIGSTLGSVWVNRWELARGARVRMYRDLVPALIDQTTDTAGRGRRAPDLVEALYREGALGRHAERTLIDAVLDAWHEQARRAVGFRLVNEYGDPIHPSQDELALWDEANERLLAGLVKLEDHLRSNLR